MRRVNLKVVLPILCSIALLFSAVGSLLASGITMTWRDEPNEVEKILERDGYLEGIWYPWFQHSYLGHCLASNELLTQVNSNATKVGIDQYGELNIYREIYNLKALGFNILGYEGSPYGEGVIYGPNGEVKGISEEYLTNVRRLLNICKAVGMPVLWSVCFHTTTVTDYYADGKYVWDVVSQAYANPEIADQYAENFVRPLCNVLAEYPETVVMVASGVELENEINDSEIGNYFDGGRLMYGVNQESMLYFMDAVTDTVAEVLPNVTRTNCGTSTDMTIYEGIDFDFLGKNHYTIHARAPQIDEMKSTLPMLVTEYGLGDGVIVEDEVWTIKQIQFRDNFINEGFKGWMYWCWSNQGYGGAYDLLDANGKSTTDFRSGAYALHYYIESYRKEHRGEEVILDAPVLFCNKGSGTVEWISSRQATSFDLLRSIDGGKTWKTLLKGANPADHTDYEGSFKGIYIDEEIANMKPDGSKVMYKVIAYDDDGNIAESEPSNEATIVGPPINILEEQGLNYSFENGLEGWTEFGANGTYADGANYYAGTKEVSDAPEGNKVLEFKLNTTYVGDELKFKGDWSGISLDGFDVKPNTGYKLIVKYKIAPDAVNFDFEESDEVNKMSGYLFIRGLGADGKGNGLGDIHDDSIASIYLLRGSKNEWREDSITFKTNESGKLGLDLRAVKFQDVPVHYYIDYIQIYEIL